MVAAVLLGALAFGTLAAAKAADPICAVAEPAEANWGSNRPVAPNRDDRTFNLFTYAEEQYLGFGVGQRQGTHAAVVDSNTLQVSTDAGCTWELAYGFDRDLDPTGEIEPATSRFAAVAVSDAASGPERIVALVFDLESGFSARVRTLVSDDGGASFEVGGVGLPNALVLPWTAGSGCGPGRGCLLTIAPSDPNRVYVLLGDVDGTSLYVSRDGGHNFSVATNGGVFSEASTASPIDLDVGRSNPNALWGGEDYGTVVSSTDGGRSWSRHDLGPAMAGATVREVLAVAALDGEDYDEVVAIVLDDDGREWTVHTFDRGLTWRAEPSELGENVVDLAAGSKNFEFIATTEGTGAWGLDVLTLSWSRLGGASLGPLSDIHPLVGSSTIWFRGPGSLPVRGDVAFQPPDILPDFGFGVLPFDPLNPVGRLPGTLALPRDVIALDVEQSTLVEAVLHLPKTPTPLDVFFMFDESGSMSEEMSALAQGMAEITRELVKRRVNLNVGLGGYGGGWRYLLRRDIGPPDAEFQRALESLGDGGGSMETAYTALHQMALGTGLPDTENGGKGPEEGWNAHWRGGAIRIAINLTDERLQPEAFPTPDDTLTALIEQRIRVIGLVSGDRAPEEISPEAPLSVDGPVHEDDSLFGPVAVMARKTEALAPRGGVDCGADGEIDIPTNGPLACYLSPLLLAPSEADALDLLPDLADVMVEILESVTEEHEVTFYRQFPDVITDVTPMVPTLVDIRDPQTIPVRLRITCPPEREGEVLRPLVTAVASSRILAAGNLTVACGPVERVALGALGPLVAAVAPAPAPLPPPAPATAAAQASSTAQAAASAQAPAAATSVIPQVGVAAVVQQEQQVQVASIDKDRPARRGEEAGIVYEFAAKRDPSPAPATLVLGAAMSLGAAALARRRRDAPVASTARVRLGR